MDTRSRIAFAFIAAAAACAPALASASPDAPMCVVDRPLLSSMSSELAPWRAPMCGPYLARAPIAPSVPSVTRAIEAYRSASDEIAAADYEEARLHLDLARRGLTRIQDRVALQSGRLELLRQRPEKAAEFFARAEESPHESVRVEASFARVFALLRADDPGAVDALQELLAAYPEVPKRAELQFELAQSFLRQGRIDEALAAMHALRVRHPGSRTAGWAETEIARLAARGHAAPPLSDDERIERARVLVQRGPLDEAKRALRALLDSPLSGEQHAEVHYLAGRIARFEGRWEAAETYMRTAQLFPMPSPTAARTIESRAEDMADAANARDPDEARRRLSEIRAGRRDTALPSGSILEMIEIAAAANLREDTNELLATLQSRKGVSATALFDAAMAARGAADDARLVALLEDVATRPRSRYRAAALYHLARVHEEALRKNEAEAFFTQAKRAAELSGDDYYGLWARIGLERVLRNASSSGREGLRDPGGQTAPSPPRASDRALAERLEPIAERHSDSYPWLARAVDLLRIGERDAATEELFETYLQWRHALGRPIARAGLDCVARADARNNAPIASDVRSARLELSDAERETLITIAVALGDMGTAGGFGGPGFIESLPRAYEWLVIPAAKRYGVDPNLLLAVMRVESAYQKHIVSYAGAVGLMQIMPRTGQLIAHALDRKDFTPADLLDPRVNLEFAAWYLASLIRRFDGHLPLAIASYNGGPHNVRRWIQESPEDMPLDALLERIPFTQTHRYVRKVLVHYEAYRRQHELPTPQLSVALPNPRVDPLAF